jgi:hypothetical protein
MCIEPKNFLKIKSVNINEILVTMQSQVFQSIQVQHYALQSSSLVFNKKEMTQNQIYICGLQKSIMFL